MRCYDASKVKSFGARRELWLRNTNVGKEVVPNRSLAECLKEGEIKYTVLEPFETNPKEVWSIF